MPRFGGGIGISSPPRTTARIKAPDSQELMNALIETIGDAIGVLAAGPKRTAPSVLLGIKQPPFSCRQGVAQIHDQIGHLLVARR